MKRDKCIIFGGGGFIGSHLCDELINYGYDVTIFEKLNFSKNNVIHLEGKINIIEGDFKNQFDIIESLKGQKYVFHLVSSTLPSSSNQNPKYDVESNLIPSLTLFESCLKKNIEKVIFISSGGTVYGIPEYLPINEDHPTKPICSYGIVKKAIEDYLFMYNKIYGLNYNVFRISNPYGERQNPLLAQGAVSVFIYKSITEDLIDIWGDGGVIRDYIYIKDAVKVIAQSAEKKTEKNIFNLSSGKGITLNEILYIIKEISGKRLNVKYSESRKIDVPVNVLDNSAVKKIFQWEPETTFNKGIEKTYNYIRELY